MRWSWLVPAVAVFGFAVGTHALISAHSAHWGMMSGRISEYHEVHGKSTSRFFHIEGSPQEYDLNSLHQASPPAPQLYTDIGAQVDLYVNSDDATDVLAMRIRETLYTADLYLHPEHQVWGTIWSGAPIALVSGAVVVVSAWSIASRRKHPAQEMTGVEKRAHQAMRM